MMYMSHFFEHISVQNSIPRHFNIIGGVNHDDNT